MALKRKTIKNKPIESACHIFYDEQTFRSLVVDPGSEDMRHIEAFLDECNLKVDYIILTHEHFDHIWGCNRMLDKYNPTIICSSYCAEALPNPKLNLSAFYDPDKAFAVVTENIRIACDISNTIEWNGYLLNFWDAQGHSKGGLIFKIGKFIVTGDTLIKDLKTVTKLKNASKLKLQESLDLLESMMGNGYLICGGHGEVFELDTYNLNKAYGIDNH